VKYPAFFIVARWPYFRPNNSKWPTKYILAGKNFRLENGGLAQKRPKILSKYFIGGKPYVMQFFSAV
jgi:hypothetical protein